jgi:hypothetical protein
LRTIGEVGVGQEFGSTAALVRGATETETEIETVTETPEG